MSVQMSVQMSIPKVNIETLRKCISTALIRRQDFNRSLEQHLIRDYRWMGVIPHHWPHTSRVRFVCKLRSKFMSNSCSSRCHERLVQTENEILVQLLLFLWAWWSSCFFGPNDPPVSLGLIRPLFFLASSLSIISIIPAIWVKQNL